MRIGTSAVVRARSSDIRSTALTRSVPAFSISVPTPAAERNGVATRSSSSGRSSTLSPALDIVSRKLLPAPARLRPGSASAIVASYTRWATRTQSTTHSTTPTSAATCTRRRPGMSLYSFMRAPHVVGPHRGPGLDSHRAPPGRSRPGNGAGANDETDRAR